MGLSQGAEQEPDGHSVRAPEFLCEERRTQSTNQAFGRVTRQKPLPLKRHMASHLEFAKRHLKAPQTMRHKILWSLVRKPCVMFGGNQAALVTNVLAPAKHGGSSIMLGDVLQQEELGDL